MCWGDNRPDPTLNKMECQLADPKPLSILDIDFDVSQPYEAGHTVTDAEAKALNQVRRENLGNNFRGVVKKAQEEAATAGKEVDIDALKAAFATLDSEYQFTIREVNATRKFDPVEREARNLVKAELRNYFAAQDPPQKFSDLPEDEQERLIEANATSPEVVAIAKGIVKQKSKISGINLSTGADTATGGEAQAADATT